MRVTHVITRLIIGGAQENTVDSVLGLKQKSDLRVHLISGPTRGREGTLEPRFDPHPGTLRIVPELVRPIRLFKDWRTLGRLRDIFLELRPDIVHTHSGKAGILGRLAAADARVPVVIHTIHGPSFGAFQGPIPNAIFRYAEQRAAKATTHFVTVADAMKEQYLAAGIGRPEQYTRVFSGFKLEAFLNATNDLRLRNQFGLAPEDIVVGKIGRLVPLKGHDDLFAIATQLIQKSPRLKFLLVGDGPLRERFEREAESLGLKRYFVFAGLVPPEDMARLIGIMDVVVHLSSREGLPRALPQSLAAGRPIIAYDSDGAREVCMDGQTGFLIKRADLVTLQRRIVQLADNPALRESLGNAGRKFVQERFSIEHMVDELYLLYHRLSATDQTLGNKGYENRISN